MSDREKVQDVLYREARLLDQHQYDEWLAMWAPDADICYWVPSGRDDVDPRREPSIIYDDRQRLVQRVERLQNKWALAQDPAGRLVRIIGNVEVTPSESGMDVRSNFRVLEYRREITYDWTGVLQHSLTPHDGELKIVSKKCLLINNSGDLPLLSFLL